MSTKTEAELDTELGGKTRQGALDELRNNLNAVFELQLQDVLRNRLIFARLVDAWTRGPARTGASDLQGFMWQGYLAFASTTVRRMVDQDPRSVSLHNFLKALRDSQTFRLISRAEFASRYANERIKRKLSDRHYDKVTGGASELTATIVDRDIAEIRNAAQRVRRFVNTVVAHSNRVPDPATLDDLNRAIDTLAAVYDRYALALGLMRTDGLAEVEIDAELEKLWPRTSSTS
jgi:hypothetical protein